MIYLWVLYVILVTIVYMQSNAFFFSALMGMLLLFLFWPLSFVIGLIVEFIKMITEK